MRKIFLPKNHPHSASAYVMLHFYNIFLNLEHLIGNWANGSLFGSIRSSANTIYFPVWSSDTTKKLETLKDFCKEILFNTIALHKLLLKSNYSTDIVHNFPCNHLKVNFMASEAIGGFRDSANPSMVWLWDCLLTTSNFH